MPRHLICDLHEWINEIPTVPSYIPAKQQPKERVWAHWRGKKTLLSLTLVWFCKAIQRVQYRGEKLHLGRHFGVFPRSLVLRYLYRCGCLTYALSLDCFVCEVMGYCLTMAHRWSIIRILLACKGHYQYWHSTWFRKRLLVMSMLGS